MEDDAQQHPDLQQLKQLQLRHGVPAEVLELLDAGNGHDQRPPPQHGALEQRHAPAAAAPHHDSQPQQQQHAEEPVNLLSGPIEFLELDVPAAEYDHVGGPDAAALAAAMWQMQHSNLDLSQEAMHDLDAAAVAAVAELQRYGQPRRPQPQPSRQRQHRAAAAAAAAAAQAKRRRKRRSSEEEDTPDDTPEEEDEEAAAEEEEEEQARAFRQALDGEGAFAGDDAALLPDGYVTASGRILRRRAPQQQPQQQTQPGRRSRRQQQQQQQQLSQDGDADGGDGGGGDSEGPRQEGRAQQQQQQQPYVGGNPNPHATIGKQRQARQRDLTVEELEIETAYLVGINESQLEEEEAAMLPPGTNPATYIQVRVASRGVGGKETARLPACWRRASSGAHREGGAVVCRASAPHPLRDRKALMPAPTPARWCVQVRNHVLARWRQDVSRFLSLPEASLRIMARHKPLVEVAWTFLNTHGWINFGVAPALLKDPTVAHPPKQTVIVIGAGLAGARLHTLALFLSFATPSARQAAGAFPSLCQACASPHLPDLLTAQQQRWPPLLLCGQSFLSI